jgi:2-amino-4-hydroxy-6-hydroxymethyldihydropteridine diphosphokinase
MHLARIGLGSNVGDGAAQIAAAFEALEALGRVTARSALYRSAAWGVADQADFTNAAALLETSRDPHALLAGLKAIEARLGRVVTFRWGPRAIDLDILAFDDVRLAEPELTIPHARLLERAFALAPLAEIEPAYAGALAALPQAQRSAVQRIPVATARKERAVTWDETLERVRSAAAFCADAGLARVRIDEGQLGIDVRRTLRAAAPALALEPADATVVSGVISTNGAAAHDEHPRNILKAEFVGIVRLSRPSVALGAMLASDRELAYVESLGIRNPIRSGGPGTVAEIFVSDGQAVEYGQPLFAIEA